MNRKENDNLIIDGNAFYEVDCECLKKGLNKKEREEMEKKIRQQEPKKNYI